MTKRFSKKPRDGHLTADLIYFGLISLQVIAYKLVYMLFILQMGPVTLCRTVQLAVDRLYNSQSV